MPGSAEAELLGLAWGDQLNQGRVWAAGKKPCPRSAEQGSLRAAKSQGFKQMGREHIRVAQPAPDKGVASRHQNRSRLKLSKDQRLEPKEEVLSVEIARFLAAREGPNAGGDGVSMCVGCCMAERSRKQLFPQQGATGVVKGCQNPPRSSS